MHLFDLPIDIISKILPVDEYVLKVPVSIGIKLINNLPSLKRAQSVISFLSGEDIHNSDSPCQQFAFERMYSRYIYVNTDIDIDPPYYNQYIILEFRDVQVCAERYYRPHPPLLFKHFSTKGYKCLRFWTGKFRKSQYLWYPEVSFSPLSTTNRTLAVFEMPDKVALTREQLEALQAVNQIFGCSIEHQRVFLSNLSSVTFNLTVGKYLDVRDSLACTSNCRRPRPKQLHIHLRFKRDYIENKKIVSTAPYPEALPLEWITDLFEPTNIQSFSLSYFAPGSTIDYPEDFLRSLRGASCINISVGELDITSLPVFPQFNGPSMYLQFKVGLEFYKRIKDRYHRGVWKVFTDYDGATFVNASRTKLFF